MKLEEHEQRCVEKFGKPYTEVHRFLDQFMEKYGPPHRRLLHHRPGIELIGEKFGAEAALAAELHIRDDFGFVPENWLQHQSFTPWSDYLQQRQQQDLIQLFGEEQVRTTERQHRLRGLIEED